MQNEILHKTKHFLATDREKRKTTIAASFGKKDKTLPYQQNIQPSLYPNSDLQ